MKEGQVGLLRIPTNFKSAYILRQFIVASGQVMDVVMSDRLVVLHTTDFYFHGLIHIIDGPAQCYHLKRNGLLDRDGIIAAGWWPNVHGYNKYTRSSS